MNTTILPTPPDLRFSRGLKILRRHFIGDGASVTYPHCNGFLPDGRRMVYRQDTGELTSQLFVLDLETFKSTPLPAIVPPDPSVRAGISFDVALDTPRLAAIAHRIAWVIDLDVDHPEWRQVYASPEGAKQQDLPSISPDGLRFLTGETRADSHAAIEIDLASMTPRTLFEHAWYANHFHYCPHDPSWIGYAHEGPTDQCLDRCWAWHPEHAPQGRCVFDQFATAEDRSKPLNAGHERWCFHDRSAYVIAYAVSPGGKRGLYEIFADGRPPRLLRESNTVWHCNMDASGRIAVVDTSAAWDPTPASPSEHAAGVAAHLTADRERLSNFSDVVLLDLATGKDLHVDRVIRTRHPWHPHPALSADGRWLVYNDADPSRRGAWIVELDV